MKYKAYPGVIKTSVCGKSFLIIPDKTIEINETAAFYWEELVNGIDENDLIERTQRDYEVEDEESLKKDIQSLTESLVENRLLVRSSE